VDLDQLVGKRVFNKLHKLEGVVERKVVIDFVPYLLFVSDTENKNLHNGKIDRYIDDVDKPNRCWYFNKFNSQHLVLTAEDEEELWV
jgi:hypothetical protein